MEPVASIHLWEIAGIILIVGISLTCHSWVNQMHFLLKTVIFISYFFKDKDEVELVSEPTCYVLGAINSYLSCTLQNCEKKIELNESMNHFQETK